MAAGAGPPTRGALPEGSVKDGTGVDLRPDRRVGEGAGRKRPGAAARPASRGQGTLPELQGTVADPFPQRGLAAVGALPPADRLRTRQPPPDPVQTSPERAFSTAAVARTSSMYFASVTWGRGSLDRRMYGYGSCITWANCVLD